MKKSLLLILMMLIAWATYAQVPGTLSFQGILVKGDGTPADDGAHNVKFYFYDAASSGTLLYSSIGIGSGNLVTTYKGLFTFVIGSGSSNNLPIGSSVFSQEVYVELVADNVTLAPRIQLTSVPYANVAQSANSMDAANLSGTLNPARIAAGTIDNTLLASGIDAAKLTTGTLPIARIADGAVTSAKITDATIATGDLADGAVTSLKITDATIATGDLADGAVTSLKITDATIATGDLADGAVTSLKITDATIATGDLADNAITNPKLADNAVANAELADNAVANAELADNAVTTAEIADNAVTTAEIGTAGLTDAQKVLATDANGDPLWFTPTNARTLLGLVPGTHVQAYDGDLDDLSSDGNLSVPRGGTGAATLTGAVIGNGTGAFTAVNHSAGSQYLRRNSGNTAYEFGAISLATGEIADNAITNPKLADNAVGNAEIADDAVTVTEIGTAGVGDANKVLTTDGFGDPQWVAKASATGLTVSNGLTLSSNNIVLGGTALSANTTLPSGGFSLNFGGGGNLGIGSVTPGSRLSVGGNAAIGNTFEPFGAPVNGLIVQGTTGIGTNNPNRKLHVVGDGTTESSDEIAAEGNGTTTPQLNLIRTTGTFAAPAGTAAGDIGRINFEGHSGTAFYTAALIMAKAENIFSSGATVNGALAFTVSAGGALSERMRIASTGNVGIGTNAPASKLDIEGGVAIGATYSGTTAAPSNGAIIEGTVGIGTNAPTSTSKLHVFSGAGSGGGAYNSGVKGIIEGSGQTFFEMNGATWAGYTFNDDATSLRAGMFYSYGSDYLMFKTGGVDNRMIIDEAGNMGIGTTTPGVSKLNINTADAVNSTGLFIQNNYSGASVKYGIDVNVDGTGSGSKYGISSSVVGLAADASSIYGYQVAMTPNGTGTCYGLYSTISSVSTGERRGVYSSVGSLTGNTNSIYGVYASASGSGTGTHYGVFASANGAGTDYGLYCSGNGVYTGTWTLLSDRKFKKDIKPIENALPRIMQLKPSTYYLKTDEYNYMGFSNDLQVGLIAQEVESVFPEVVTNNTHPGLTDENGKSLTQPIEFKGVDYTRLVAPMIKAIQEQQSQIEELKAQLEQYKNLSTEFAELKKLVSAQIKSQTPTTQSTSSDVGQKK